MKFVMTQSICPEGIEKLKADTNGQVEIIAEDNPDPNNYLDDMQDADALIVRIAKCDAHAIENSPKLKVIGRTGVGYDSVDVKKATELGIPVVITPGANNRSVAEHAVAMMFALSKNLYEGQVETEKGNWEIRGVHKAFELEGKTVGVIGLGAIGRETAKICQGVGMKVAGYDPFMSQDKIEALGAEYYADYKELLKVADIVTVHVPPDRPDPRHDQCSRAGHHEKKTALVINCSRGGIVNEADLCAALRAGTIAGAGTDVFCNEPPKPDDPLLNTPNLIVSPHSAAQTREAVIKMAKMCVNGCLAVIRGEWPFVADKKVYDHPKWADK